jgi:hypothetical protein
MRYATFLTSLLVLATTSGTALADPGPTFIGPSGWSHNPPAVTDPNRTIDQWHLSGDVASVTFIKDPSTTYSDAVAAIEKNFSTNKIKPAADKDTSCRGTTAHLVEFAIGPGEHQIIIHRLVVPDGSGVDTVTYTRSDGSPFDPDVKKSETTYCSS